METMSHIHSCSKFNVIESTYLVLESGVGKGGKRGPRAIKSKLKKWCRSGVFLVLTVFALAYHAVSGAVERYNGEHNWDVGHRWLEGGCVEPANPSALCLPYTIGCCYLLLALAIVADEFFVPALTLIGEYLELSEDVTGATLMAMGGSAPELFTNAAGTFARSDVGFGAIVGSAVFNLLFVIGIVAALATKPLQLTWYPLTRDSSYYMIVLISLAIFFGVTSPGVMELWESLILHIEYWLYVLLMRYSARIQQYFDKSQSQSESAQTGLDIAIVNPAARKSSIDAPLLNPKYNFRSGVMNMVVRNKSASQVTEMALVGKLLGEVNAAFDSVDSDKSGKIDFSEMQACLVRLGLASTLEQARALFNAIDTDKNGTIDREEFSHWFKRSRHMIELEVKVVFDALDADKSGYLDKQEVGVMMETLGSGKLQDEALDLCYIEMLGGGSSGSGKVDVNGPGVSLDQFMTWYFLDSNDKGYAGKITAGAKDKIPAARAEGEKKEKEKGEDEDEDEDEEEDGLSIFPNGKTGSAFVWYLVMLPIALAFTYTIPDVKQQSMKSIRYAILAFVICLVWMGIICYFNVDWIEIIGATAGIPSVIMGLTFLAAGTSVPDMLGAIIVAKRGQGDMAVSSSVGSNVFDICVGLALPWLLFYAVYGEDYTVGADSLFVSIIIIVISVATVLISLKINKWLHTKTTGYIFMAGYGAFVAQQLARVDWSNPGC